jgi:hypothetical protein
MIGLEPSSLNPLHEATNLVGMIITTLILCFTLTTSANQSETTVAAKSQSAAQVVENFYADYIGKFLRKKNRPSLPFSKAFQALIDKNSSVCKEKAGTDICGYGAGGDIYFNAQEIDPHLTVKSSGLKVIEPIPGDVHVKLNVFPSSRGSKAGDISDYYYRHMIFKMIQEEGRWVVDDILTTSSSRKEVEDQTKYFESRK